MAEQKHTPGTWRAGRGNVTQPIEIYAGDSLRDGVPVARIDGQDDVAKANARLIAAAPDLLEALKAMRDAAVYECAATADTKFRDEAHSKFAAAITLASAAIAKATGA